MEKLQGGYEELKVLSRCNEGGRSQKIAVAEKKSKGFERLVDRL
jgi:hypothetical protein